MGNIEAPARDATGLLKTGKRLFTFDSPRNEWLVKLGMQGVTPGTFPHQEFAHAAPKPEHDVSRRDSLQVSLTAAQINKEIAGGISEGLSGSGQLLCLQTLDHALALAAPGSQDRRLLC
jgi:hypothetical protein